MAPLLPVPRNPPRPASPAAKPRAAAPPAAVPLLPDPERSRLILMPGRRRKASNSIRHCANSVGDNPPNPSASRAIIRRPESKAGTPALRNVEWASGLRPRAGAHAPLREMSWLRPSWGMPPACVRSRSARPGRTGEDTHPTPFAAVEIRPPPRRATVRRAGALPHEGGDDPTAGEPSAPQRGARAAVGYAFGLRAVALRAAAPPPATAWLPRARTRGLSPSALRFLPVPE